MTRKKVQITLPEELKSRIEEEAKKDFMSVSSWIERAIVQRLSNKQTKREKNEKVIDLGI